MHTATRGPGRRKHHYSNTLNTTEVRGGRWKGRGRSDPLFPSSLGVELRAGRDTRRQTETSASPGRGHGGQTHHQEGHQAHHADCPHPPLHSRRHPDGHPLRLLLRHQAAPRCAGHGGQDG